MFETAFAQQGWQCPVCGRVYSPSTTMCLYCNNNTERTASTTGTYKIEWGHTESKTQGGGEDG